MEGVIDILYIGLTEYSEALHLQQGFFEKLLAEKQNKNSRREGDCGIEEIHDLGKRTDNIKGRQVLILCEHPHVYTLGKHGHEDNLLVNREFLQSIGATYYRTDRGGDITYHGYGQLVGYPVLDLERLGLGLKDYVYALEESVIRAVGEYGIRGERMSGATGVWLEPDKPTARKICAIGVKSSRFVTMHGFALNVSTDLKYFSYINPCGFVDKGVTSIERECGYAPSLEEVAEKYVVHFKKIIN